MAGDSTDSAAPEGLPTSRWLLLLIAMPLFMANLDQTIVIIAVPRIAESFGRQAAELSSIFSFYVLAMLVTIPLAGWLTERLGARRVFLMSVLIFGLGSLAAANAPGLSALIAARALQGAGAGLMTPVARIVLQTEVPRRNLVAAIAWYTTPAVLGPVLGPGLGGLLLRYADWPVIFHVNLPVVGLTLLMGWILLRERERPKPRRFDLFGYLLLAGAVLLIVTSLTFAGKEGMQAHAGLLAFAGVLAGIAGWFGYVAHARRASAPLIPLGILGDQVYRSILLSGSLFRIGVSALPFICSILLQTGHGLRPETAGMLISMLAVGALSVKPVTPWILNRLGYRRVLWLDIIGSVISFILLALLLLPEVPSLPLLACGFFFCGVFRSLHFMALNSLTFSTIPPETLGAASTLSSLAQHTTLGLGVVLAGLALSLVSGVSHGPIWVLLAFGILVQLSAFWFLRLPENVGDEMLRRDPPRRDGE